MKLGKRFPWISNENEFRKSWTNEPALPEDATRRGESSFIKELHEEDDGEGEKEEEKFRKEQHGSWNELRLPRRSFDE